jgi:hypothetical protein
LSSPFPSNDPDAPANQLPLVQDSLFYALPGWYFEHDWDRSVAEKRPYTLTIRVRDDDFELILSAPGRPDVRDSAGPSADDVLRAIERLAAQAG